MMLAVLLATLALAAPDERPGAADAALVLKLFAAANAGEDQVVASLCAAGVSPPAIGQRPKRTPTRVFAGGDGDVIVLGWIGGVDPIAAADSVPAHDGAFTVPAVDVLTLSNGVVVRWDTVVENGQRRAQEAVNGLAAAAVPPLPTTPPELVLGPPAALDQTQTMALRFFTGTVEDVPELADVAGVYRGHVLKIDRRWSIGAWSIAIGAITDIVFAGEVQMVPVVAFARHADDRIVESLHVGLSPRIRGRVARSPDGSRIAYVLDYDGMRSVGGFAYPAGDVVVAAGDGSRPKRISDSGLAREPTWLPDGRLAFGDEAHVMLAAADGSGVRRIVSGTRFHPFCSETPAERCTLVAVSPDSRFAASACPRVDFEVEYPVRVSEVASGRTLHDIMVAPGPLTVLWQDGTLHVGFTVGQPDDPKPSETVIDRAWFEQAITQPDPNLTGTPLPAGVTWLTGASRSPDGRRVLATGYRAAAGPIADGTMDPIPPSDIYIRYLAGGPWVAFTDTGDAEHAVWSPDGRAVAYVVRGALIVADARGHELQRLRASEETVWGAPPSWSPDASHVLGAFDYENVLQLVVLDRIGRRRGETSVSRTRCGEVGARFDENLDLLLAPRFEGQTIIRLQQQQLTWAPVVTIDTPP